MEINLRLDTSQPSDLAALAKLAAAFNGSAPTVAPAPAKTAPAATAATATVNTAAPAATQTPPAATSAPATEGRVTIEQIRAVVALKKNSAVKAVMTSLGIDALSAAPDEKLPALLAGINELPNK